MAVCHRARTLAPRGSHYHQRSMYMTTTQQTLVDASAVQYWHTSPPITAYFIALLNKVKDSHLCLCLVYAAPRARQVTNWQATEDLRIWLPDPAQCFVPLSRLRDLDYPAGGVYWTVVRSGFTHLVLQMKRRERSGELTPDSSFGDRPVAEVVPGARGKEIQLLRPAPTESGGEPSEGATGLLVPRAGGAALEAPAGEEDAQQQQQDGQQQQQLSEQEAQPQQQVQEHAEEQRQQQQQRPRLHSGDRGTTEAGPVRQQDSQPGSDAERAARRAAHAISKSKSIAFLAQEEAGRVRSARGRPCPPTVLLCVMCTDCAFHAYTSSVCLRRNLGAYSSHRQCTLACAVFRVALRPREGVHVRGRFCRSLALRTPTWPPCYESALWSSVAVNQYHTQKHIASFLLLFSCGFWRRAPAICPPNRRPRSWTSGQDRCVRLASKQAILACLVPPMHDRVQPGFCLATPP